MNPSTAKALSALLTEFRLTVLAALPEPFTVAKPCCRCGGALTVRRGRAGRLLAYHPQRSRACRFDGRFGHGLRESRL